MEAASDLRAAYPQLSWVDPAYYHLTLAFLGEQGPAGLACAKLGLLAIKEMPAARVGLSRFGSFPSRGPWRVLVAELNNGPGLARGSILVIHRRLNEALAKAAAKAELAPLNEEWPSDSSRPGRPFRPHITLARKGSGRGSEGGSLDPELLREAENKIRKGMPPGGWPLEACVLYKSELRPSGAVYTELDRAGLASL